MFTSAGVGSVYVCCWYFGLFFFFSIVFCFLCYFCSLSFYRRKGGEGAWGFFVFFCVFFFFVVSFLFFVYDVLLVNYFLMFLKGYHGLNSNYFFQAQDGQGWWMWRGYILHRPNPNLIRPCFYKTDCLNKKHIKYASRKWSKKQYLDMTICFSVVSTSCVTFRGAYDCHHSCCLCEIRW